MAIGKTNSCGSTDANYPALLNGTLTEFSAPKAKVTTLAPYRFYEFANLTKANFTGLSEIPRYACYNCTKLTEITVPSTVDIISESAFQECTNLVGELAFNNCNIASNAFRNTKISKISGTVTNIGSSAFYSNSSLQSVSLKIDGAVLSSAFNNAYINNFDINTQSVITTLESNCFSYIGKNRQNPENNVFNIDFSNSTFTSIGSSAFSYTTYIDLIFPTTMTTINSSAFSSSSYLNLYYKNVPTLSNTNVFSSATNFKNFFPYDLVQTAKTSTNWSSSTYGIVDSIYGYAPANTFTQGEELPVVDSNGYALTWYSDIAMTQQVTTADTPTQVYYCQVGARTFTKLAKISEFQATCTVSDGTKTYAEGDLIQIGTVLTIAAVGEGENTQVYQFTLNGTNITSGYEYTAGEDNISIICIYWDGVNVPVNPTFSENTPAQIKVGLDTGVGKTLWTVGDTIPITLTDGTQYNLMLYDMTENRYQKSDNSGYSNGVLGFVEITQKAQMNTTNTNVGGWAQSHMKTVTMEEILNKLPAEWQAVISEVKVASTVGGVSTAISYSDNKVFLPARVEFFPGTTDAGLKDEGTLYEYFVGTGTDPDPKRIKYYQGAAQYYWLRSPSPNISYYFYYVYTSGGWLNSTAIITNGVAACFAI